MTANAVTITNLLAILSELIEAPVEAPKKAKARCDAHGVWAREDDHRCARCDREEADALLGADERRAAQEALEDAQGPLVCEPAVRLSPEVIAEALGASHPDIALKVAAILAEINAPAKVTQAVLPLERAKVTIGVTQGKQVARRSLYAAAEALGVDPQDYKARAELRGLGVAGLRERLAKAGLEMVEVPAASL